MDNSNLSDLQGQLSLRKNELKELTYERETLFDPSRKVTKNLRDINENINECCREITLIRSAMKALNNNILPSKNNLVISKTLHTFA